MTVQTELDKPAGRIEWILCIEGIGWLTDEASFSSGFDGDVFVTEDLDGDLATVLGCTIHPGLLMPEVALEERFDPLSLEYTKGSLRFGVQDQDDILLDRIRPLDAGAKLATIDTGDALTYTSTTVVLNEVATFAAGDVIWIAGREAVLLGTRSAVAGTVFSYADCTRGYLGTPRGRLDARPTGLDGMAWAEGTDVRDYNRFWWDRRVMLFAHVPGETVANVALVYAGRLRGIKQRKQGLVWDIPTVHDASFYSNRYHESSTRNKLVMDMFVGLNAKGRSYADYLNGEPVGPAYTQSEQSYYADFNWALEWRVQRRLYIRTEGGDAFDYYALPYAYHYRRAPGGSHGVGPAVDSDPTAPQALVDGESRYVIGGLISVGGIILRALYKTPDRGSVAYDFRTIQTQGWNLHLGSTAKKADSGSELRYLLDNHEDNATRSRFTLPADGGGSFVSRNVVDVALMFLTTMNAEFYRANAAALSTTTNVIFAGTPFADVGDDHWIGYALFAVEDSNLGEARVISDSDDNDVTVDTAFTNTPTAGTEYQIRNTIYDVLPIGWGLGIPNHKIDLDAWEDMRDKYLFGAQLGKFAIGDEDRIDLWEMLQKNIFRPFGILPYIDRTTGKLSARYVGEVSPTGIDETYTTIGVSDMLGVGDIDLIPRAPAGSVEVEVRGAGNAVSAQMELRYVQPLASGPYEPLTVRSEEIDSIFASGELSVIKVDAHFNDIDHVGYLSARMIAHLRRYANPPPEVDIPLNLSWILKLNIGQVYSITDTTRWNPINPYTGARGWTAMLARAVGIKINLSRSRPSVTAKFQLLSSGNHGRIAPAASVASKGSDGGGEFFQCADFTYALDESSGNEDWSRFGDNDRIELRDSTGALKEGPEVVNGTPASGKVYIDGTIAAAIAAGDYITFSAWSSSNTDNMDKYAALADSSEELGADPDDAKEYA